MKKYKRNKDRDAAREQRLASVLGMLPATAMSRLRKIVLFNQLKKHGENVCVRCKQEIEFSEQLSIEHIEPWEEKENSVDLFWNLNNIAFSHLRCNMPHSRWGGRNKRKIGLSGTAWCIGHQLFFPVDQFSKSCWNWSGLQKYCKDCLSLRKTGKYNLTEVRKIQCASNLIN